jgi:hypothetical protein
MLASAVASLKSSGETTQALSLPCCMGTDLFEPRGHSIADSLFCECSLLETSGQEAVEAVLRTPNND